jgi:hypothetical protein
VTRVLVDGTEASLKKRLKRSKVSRTINTSFVERLHGTDRGRNARKVRRTYRFSKDWEVHEAMTYFTLYNEDGLESAKPDLQSTFKKPGA